MVTLSVRLRESDLQYYLYISRVFGLLQFLIS